MAYRTITEEMDREVREMIAMHFSNHYIHERTGISRETIKAIRDGKRKAVANQWRASQKELYRPRSPDQIKQEAVEALIRANRMSIRFLEK